MHRIGRIENSIHVGVTGHREVGLQNADLELLRSTVQRTFDIISTSVPGSVLIIYSPLADGADQLVARSAIESGHCLRAVLPFDAEEVARDLHGTSGRDALPGFLEKAESVEILAGGTASEDDKVSAYQAAGRRVVDQSDLLLAIWDGRPGRGVAGTADVIEMAKDSGVPIVWIQAASPHAVTIVEPRNWNREHDPRAIILSALSPLASI
jgi:hypothetical protein